MRKGEMAKKAEKLTIWIVVLSIIGLFLMSFLPWISVTENDSVKEDLFFSFDMMRKSDNEEIRDLADNLNIINISFWVLITLGLLSFLGATIHASGKIPFAGQILMMVGCATLICSILVVDLQLVILQNIEAMGAISAAAIFSPINYPYIHLIPGVITLICSVSYTWVFVSYSIQKFKGSKKTKKGNKLEKKASKKASKKKSKTEIKKPFKKEEPALEKKPLKPETHGKRIEMEQWLTGEIQNIEKQDIEEKQIKAGETKQPKQPFRKEESPVIQKEQTKDEEQNSSEKKGKSDVQVEKEPEENEPEKKKYKVRCPQCKYTFPIEKEGEVTKIKCPKCGKEGFVR